MISLQMPASTWKILYFEGISVVAGLATVGILVGRAGLWRRGLLGPASCGGCRPTAVWQDLPVGPGGPRSWHQPAGGRWGQVHRA